LEKNPKIFSQMVKKWPFTLVQSVKKITKRTHPRLLQRFHVRVSSEGFTVFLPQKTVMFNLNHQQKNGDFSTIFPERPTPPATVCYTTQPPLDTLAVNVGNDARSP